MNEGNPVSPQVQAELFTVEDWQDTVKDWTDENVEIVLGFADLNHSLRMKKFTAIYLDGTIRRSDWHKFMLAVMDLSDEAFGKLVIALRNKQQN